MPSLVWGQPKVESGHKAELNQVSRTSGSRVNLWPTSASSSISILKHPEY